MGFLGVPPVEDESQIQQQSVEDVVAASADGGARLRLSLRLGAQTSVAWNALLLRRALYLRPGETLPDGSKEAFVALLEYAEEALQCTHIYVCFPKTALPRALVRNFQFLGFSPVAPGDASAPSSANYFSLVYTITDEEDDLFDDADDLQ